MDSKRPNSGPLRGGASQAKRGKAAGEWEDSPSQFEEELSMFDDVDMDAEESEGQAGHDVIPVGECYTQPPAFPLLKDYVMGPSIKIPCIRICFSFCCLKVRSFC